MNLCVYFSTNEAKTDFMRIIRQTIRDSVRKMTLPNQQSSKNKYIPYGGKRLEALSSNPRSTLSNKRSSSSSKNQDAERHSVEFEEKFSVLETDPTFRTRSKTVGDLNEVSGEEGEKDVFAMASQPELAQNGGSDNSSLSNLSETSHTSSLAKLDFASANPVKHSSVMALSPIDSPVWKPRNEANAAKHLEFRTKEGKNPKILNTQSKLTLPSQPCTLKDTEC